jgi:hypothetical protein
MDSCIVCDELLGFDNLTFDDFTRYPNMCPYCCVETDEAIQVYKRLGIPMVDENLPDTYGVA